MKKFLISLLLLPGIAFAQNGGYQIPKVAGTPRTAPTPGNTMDRANVDIYGNQQVVTVSGGGSGLSQSVVPVSNSSNLNGPASGVIAGLYIGTATATGGTATVPTFASHSFRVGDWAKPISGTAANIGAWSPVTAISATTITLANALPSAPANADVLQILRPMPVVATTLTNNLAALATSIDTSTQFAASTGILKQEDVATGNNDAGVATFVKLQSALSADAANGDYGLLKADLTGRLITSPAVPEESWQSCGTATASTADVAIKAAVASNRIYTTSITCASSDADNATNINFKDGTTVIAVGGVNQMAATSAGTFVATFSVPLRGTSNTALNFNTAVSTSSVICCASGYISVN